MSLFSIELRLTFVGPRPTSKDKIRKDQLVHVSQYFRILDFYCIKYADLDACPDRNQHTQVKKYITNDILIRQIIYVYQVWCLNHA